MTAATNDLNRIIRDATIVIPQCMMLVDEIVKLINRVGDYDVNKLKSNVKNFKKLANVISDYYEALQEIIEDIVVKSKPDMMSKLVETFIKNDPTNVTGTEDAIQMTGYQLLDSTAQILFTIQKMISSLIDIMDGKKSKFLTNAKKFKKVKKLFSNALDMIFEVIDIINEKILKMSLNNLKNFDFKTFEQLEDIISGLNKIMVNLLLITPLMLIVILVSPAIILSLLVFVLILNVIFQIISLVKPKTVLEVTKGIQSINLILLQIGLLILELLLLAFLMPIVLKASLTVILGIIVIGLILTIMFSVIWLLGELIVKLNVYKNMVTVLLLMVLMIAVVASFLIFALLLLITQQIAAKLDIVVILLFLGGLLLLTVAVLAIGYLAISVGAYLMPAVAGVLLLVVSLGIIIAAVLVIALMLYVLQFLELDQEKIAENISKVIGSAMLVISSIFAPKEEEEGGGESKSWFSSVIEMVGGAALTIIQAILAVYFLALTLVAISLILFMAFELRILQDINLNTKAINKNVYIVIDTAKMVINALFEPQDDKEDAEPKSWFMSVIEMVGGAALMIIKALLSIFILALSIVAIALILFLSTQLRLLQGIELDQNAIFENIDIVIGTAKRVINSLFDSKDDKEDQPSNKNFFLTLIEFFCQPFAMIFGAIMSIGFLALTIVSIALILMIAKELQAIQKIKLDPKKINDVVTNVIDTAKLVINSIMKPDDSNPKPAKGIFRKILQMVLPSGLLNMIDAIMAIGFLALAKAAVGLVGDIAVNLTSILKLPSMKGIGQKVNTIISTTRSIIDRIINNDNEINEDSVEKFGNACKNIDSMILTINKIGDLSNTVNSLKPIDVNLASQTQKSFDIVVSLLDSITMKSKSDIDKTQRKLNQLSEMQLIIQKFNSVTPADIRNSEAMLKNYSNFLDKVDNSNLEGLQTTTNLIGKMAELSKSINGDFQGLADALNEKIAPLLEELKKSLEEIKELTQHSETTTLRNDSAGNNAQSTNLELEKKKEQSQMLTNSIDDVSSKLSELIDLFENGDARVRTT